MTVRRIAVALLACIGASLAFADDCVRDAYGDAYCGRGACLVDGYGKVHCARQGGGAMHDQYGNVVCGQGHCTADQFGRIKCSSRRGGHALVDSNWSVVCQGSCEDASPQHCEQPPRLSDAAAGR